MRKGELVRAVLVALAVAAALTGNWGALIFGAIVYGLTGTAVEALMRRTRRRAPEIEKQSGP
jgi:hypothetical protein